MPVQMELNKNARDGHKPVKIFTRDIENSALTQLKNIAGLPIVHGHVAAMPDVHTGIGATVGSVIPTREAIIPAAVGVDIGCGMNAVRLSLRASQLPDNLRGVREAIERAVPVGAGAHKKVSARMGSCQRLAPELNHLFEKHPVLLKMMRQPQETWVRQMGTLGSGNHFIEVCIDESDYVWIMLHSGSRGIGNAIGRHFIRLARKDMTRHQQQLPDKDLAYFTEGSECFDDYIEAVDWAQRYAGLNRREMMGLVVRAIALQLPPFTAIGEAINCHHNYVQKEAHFGADVYVTRKGAISARKGELGIIPGSMGAKSYIVRGKGNADALCSCAHGAGRRMSRSAARRRFSRRDMEAQTQGVECRKDKGVIDEIPGAYKDIDQVMENQRDLVEVVHTLKQVVCVKG
ncbi:RtcB family protein [Exilibacterium tricleocarpae]|uniref:3'-phosphate/5'-hydroxy nucleic acid ligase n=1 Tax=Exilibacterium tricleocarpae TaxID=2591008 RepID=A0A545SY71_9GAMM|nr:RtcB family protein [Exilibacterium tricleocarpae]TQV69915.1 RtcB family protein [Exilibacterium tricleocarpae]